MPDLPFPGASFGPDDVPADAPLFRELQRVLRAGGGPVNWELARQVGVAGGRARPPAAAPPPARMPQDAVRLAEIRVADLTGLPSPARLAVVEATDRATWTRHVIDELRPVLDPAIARMAEAVARAGREGVPPEAGDVAAGLLGQLSPLLMGAQIGSSVGDFARSAFATYSIPIPRGDVHLRFLTANVTRFAADWSLDLLELTTWVALREVTLRTVTSLPWIDAHLAGLLDDWSSTLRVDVAGLQERMTRLDPADPDAMRGLLAGPDGEDGLGPVMDDEQTRKLRRIESFVAALEGYADHIARTVAEGLLPGAARIAEAVGRHGAAGAGAVARLLGVAVPPDSARRGEAFCRAVVELVDEATLARMWRDAESLPSWPEIEEPRLWLARSA